MIEKIFHLLLSGNENKNNDCIVYNERITNTWGKTYGRKYIKSSLIILFLTTVIWINKKICRLLPSYLVSRARWVLCLIHSI